MNGNGNYLKINIDFDNFFSWFDGAEAGRNEMRAGTYARPGRETQLPIGQILANAYENSSLLKSYPDNCAGKNWFTVLCKYANQIESLRYSNSETSFYTEARWIGLFIEGLSELMNSDDYHYICESPVIPIEKQSAVPEMWYRESVINDAIVHYVGSEILKTQGTHAHISNAVSESKHLSGLFVQDRPLAIWKYLSRDESGKRILEQLLTITWRMCTALRFTMKIPGLYRVFSFTDCDMKICRPCREKKCGKLRGNDFSIPQKAFFFIARTLVQDAWRQMAQLNKNGIEDIWERNPLAVLLFTAITFAELPIRLCWSDIEIVNDKSKLTNAFMACKSLILNQDGGTRNVAELKHDIGGIPGEILTKIKSSGLPLVNNENRILLQLALQKMNLIKTGSELVIPQIYLREELKSNDFLGYLKDQVQQGDRPHIENQYAIKKLAHKFSTYQNRTPAITNEDIEIWLRQFQNQSWRRLALKLLENIDYYDPESMRSMFSHFLENILPKEDRDRTIISLFGSLVDSSSIVNYTLGEVIMAYGFQAQPIETILNTLDPEEKVILFVDDNIGSGKQSVQIFRDWLGIKDQVVNERHGLPLNEDQIEKLKRFKMYLFTFVGFEEGKENIRKELQGLGLNMGSVYSFDKLEQSIGCFHRASRIFDTPEDRQEAQLMAKQIGIQLFEDKKDWSRGKKEERSLGYGNSQKLIVFYYNTPTSTLPILWKKGTYNGKPWEPLFPRREKR